jgi:hypothetical protein
VQLEREKVQMQRDIETLMGEMQHRCDGRAESVEEEERATA